jgi:uncharacterized membrane protein YdjX (TVP38/TMEM64 family)
MSANDHHESKAEKAKEALHRIEAAIDHDVEETRAIGPLVDKAATVQKQVRSKLKRALPLLGLVALGAAFIFSGVYKELNLETLAAKHQALSAWAALHPVLAVGALLLGIAAIISTGLPGGVVLVITGGLILGAVKGALIAACGDTIGALVLYGAARQLFMTEGAKPPPLVERIRSGYLSTPISLTFFIRLVPVFPYGAASVALAWLGCRLRLFIAASFLGVLPSSLIYAAIGAGFGEAIERQEPIRLNILAEPRFAIPLVGLALLALLPAAFGLKRKKPKPS